MFAIHHPATAWPALATNIAIAARLLHMEGILTYSGHVSARLPDGNGFLIHPLEVSRAAIVAKVLRRSRIERASRSRRVDQDSRRCRAGRAIGGAARGRISRRSPPRGRLLPLRRR